MCTIQTAHGRRAHLSATTPRRTRHPPGFTLLEFILVLVIIGMVGAVALPRYANAVTSFRVDGAATRVVADLALAQMRARTTGVSQTVTFDPPGNSYCLPGVPDPDHDAPTYVVELAGGEYHAEIISADLGGDPTVVFDGYGLPDSGGNVIVQAGDRRITVTLNANTGQARVGATTVQ